MYFKDQVTFPNLGNKGRLGNQLFQIAATLSASIDHNFGCIFPDWHYNQFLKNPILEYSKYIPYIFYKPTDFYTEPSFRYNNINLPDTGLKLLREDVKVYALDGYFQSRKYFENHEAFIREQFEPSEELINKLYHKYGSLQFQSCAIHVRRGDYVDLAFYHQIKMDYYERSMIKIQKETGIKHFYIFSDDIAWCKENFTNPEYKYTFIEGNTDFEDLILMSCCRHQIIANSSFSWWGAFLNRNPDKIVIFPEKWFGEVANLDATDLYY
ncbi:MAG: hypothetical protein QG594_2503 [Bacteroidota bacterium]|nr:hypothetical protein [Bacteroidota bacterium]